MITRRDVVVSVLSGLTVLGVAGAVRSQEPVLGSAAFDWDSLAVQTTKVGARRTFFDRPTATLDQLEIHATTLNPGEAPHPPHQHPDEELIIVKEGTVEALVNGRTQRVGPGSVIFQAANQRHGLRNVGPGQATYHVIRWNSPGMLKKAAK
jgi:quercetin dioxygenase-like cupin family protein